jgi:hypothetical protein
MEANMNRKSLLTLTFAAAVIVLTTGGKAENSCGVSAMTLPNVDTAQVHVWQGQTLEGNPSTSAGVFLTPFATGQVDAIVNVRVTINRGGAGVPVLFAVSDGRGSDFYAVTNPGWAAGGGLPVYFDKTFRVTSAQLYFALWTEDGTPARYFTSHTKLSVQPRVCDSGRYRAKLDVDTIPGNVNDGTIDVTWEIPSTSGFVPFPPACSRLDRRCLRQVEQWDLMWKRRP